jgi:D-alanyl-D-alanine carboxypeptidase
MRILENKTNKDLIILLKSAIKNNSNCIEIISELDFRVKTSKFRYKIKNQHVHVLNTVDGTINWNN